MTNILLLGSQIGSDQHASDNTIISVVWIVILIIIIVAVVLGIIFAVKAIVRKTRSDNRENAIELEKEKQKIIHSYDSPSSDDVAAELKKYQDLFEKGIITKEEYEAKRKQIIGL